MTQSSKNYSELEHGKVSTLLRLTMCTESCLVLQLQQSRVATFCELHKLGNQNPNVKLGFHMLIDHKKNITYCFVPKVGCTHLKVAFLQAEGQ